MLWRTPSLLRCAKKGARLSVLRVLRGQQQQLLLLLHSDVPRAVEGEEEEHAGGRDALQEEKTRSSRSELLRP